MKTIKIILIALFSISLLTAVIPSSRTELENEASNHEIKKTKIQLAGILHKKGTVPPRQG